MRRRKIAFLFATITALTMTVSGCSSASLAVGGGAPSPVSSTPASATLAPATTGTATIDNCGTSVSVGPAPTRIVSIKSSATELLLALGLGRRVVGTAFLDGPIPAQLTVDGTPKNISDFLPSQEAVLALKPDFIYGGWESNFSADGVGERSSLAGLGIGTYVSPSACKEKGLMPDPLTFASVFQEIDEAGRIFGATKQAEALVSAQKAKLKSLTLPKKSITALWYSSGKATPYVGAGIGAPEMIMQASGLKNIFANVHDTWSSVGWESVAAADPTVIVLADAAWSTAATKIAQLESNPVTASLNAVVHHRYVVLPFASTEAGVRNVDATASVITQLKKLDE